MLSLAHALVAAKIAEATHDPILSPILAFGSHFILDSIPHWDLGTNWRYRGKVKTGILAITDTVVGFLLAFVLFQSSTPLFPLILSISASLLPDWMEAPWYIFWANKHAKIYGKYSSVWERIAHAIYLTESKFHKTVPLPFGLLTQIATVGFFLILLQ